MTRVSIRDFGGELIGWFNTDSATCYEEETYWDGNNTRGLMSHLQCGHEELYRTSGGRWVRHRDATREFNGPDTWEFITDDQARDWLITNGNDEAVAEHFGTIEDERGPGRPEVGGAVHLRLGEDLLARVDARAAESGVSRAKAVRDLIAAGLS